MKNSIWPKFSQIFDIVEWKEWSEFEFEKILVEIKIEDIWGKKQLMDPTHVNQTIRQDSKNF